MKQARNQSQIFKKSIANNLRLIPCLFHLGSKVTWFKQHMCY